METQFKKDKQLKEEGIEINTNKSQPTHFTVDDAVQQIVQTEGKVTGSSSQAKASADFAFLMQAHKKHGKGSKSNNYKESKKANIRRNEKYERENQKVMQAKIEEAMEKERIEWAPKDKEDAKFQQKMAAKMVDKGPSQKHINQ